jgi:NAD(P)-dependent dehydrogenase (short-subunit alcohol dehydrogenase family)
MPGRLEDKVAIVTGGATGLGREIAKLYAEEGAKVTVADMRPEEGQQTVDEILAAGGDSRFVKMDVTDDAQVEAGVAEAEEAYGRLDVMTANAGILGRGAYERLEDVALVDFRHVIDVNLLGVMHCFRHAIPALRRAGGGAMTATASNAAHLGMPRLEAYCASKAAVVALVKCLAVDLAADNIRVNAVSPGSISTELTRHTAELKGDPDYRSGQVRGTNARAEPREIAYAHLFLVSSESSFVTGHSLIADGGRTVTAA